MDKIFEILQKIKMQHGVYIGVKNLEKLTSFMSGYECAIYEITGQRYYFDFKMQRFIEYKFGIESCTMHWSDIIEQNHTNSEAFDLFFEFLEEFKGVEKDYLDDVINHNSLI